MEHFDHIPSAPHTVMRIETQVARDIGVKKQGFRIKKQGLDGKPVKQEMYRKGGRRYKENIANKALASKLVDKKVNKIVQFQ